MVSVREVVLYDLYKKIKRKKLISVEELEELMEAVWKVMMSMKELRRSRDMWKDQYKKLKEDLKDGN